MAKILIILPLNDFDPTEVAVPWAALCTAGHHIVFASDGGAHSLADAKTLGAAAAPLPPKSLLVHDDNAALYAQMLASPAYAAPISWADAHATDFDALFFPGGHGPGMRGYCESPDVQRLAVDGFAANLFVAAICHGVLPLARATRADGQPLLTGRKSTSLTGFMEQFAILLTRRTLGDHYRTYGETVEAEARRALGPHGTYHRGPLLPRYATIMKRDIGFVVEDGKYLSARWPGDAWTLAERLCVRLANR